MARRKTPTQTRLVSVHFDGSNSRNYTYIAPFAVSVGQRVFVNSPYSGITTVTVDKVWLSDETHTSLKSLLSANDVQAAQDLIAKRTRRKEIERRLDELLASHEREERYRKLVRSSAEARALVAELKKLPA